MTKHREAVHVSKQSTDVDSARGTFRLDLPVVEGVEPPGVDVMDRRALYDFLDPPERWRRP